MSEDVLIEDELAKLLIGFQPLLAKIGVTLTWQLRTQLIQMSEMPVVGYIGVLLHAVASGRERVTGSCHIQSRKAGSGATLQCVFTDADQLPLPAATVSNLCHAFASKPGVSVTEGRVTIDYQGLIVSGRIDDAGERQIRKNRLRRFVGLGSALAGYLPTVLLVEPNKELRSFLSKLLIHDYRLLLATNEEDALSLLKQNNVDLVLTDLVLNQGSGLSLLDHMQADTLKDIPAIVLSVRTRERVVIDALQAGAVDFIPKPFTAAELLLKIKNHLERRLLTQLSEKWPLFVLTSASSNQTKDRIFLSSLNSVTLAHYEDTEFNAPRLARLMGLSERQLQRRVQQYFQQSPSHYINTVRIKKARERLVRGDSVAAVYSQVGFSSQAYFCRLFKALLGKSATQVLKEATVSDGMFSVG